MTADLPPTEIFPVRLRAAREMRQWSQNDLGAKANMPASSVAHFETGARKPSFDTLRRLANALNVQTDYLLGRTEDPSLGMEGDPIFRDIAKISDSDREIAMGFLKMLADRNPNKPTDEDQ